MEWNKICKCVWSWRLVDLQFISPKSVVKIETYSKDIRSNNSIIRNAYLWFYFTVTSCNFWNHVHATISTSIKGPPVLMALWYFSLIQIWNYVPLQSIIFVTGKSRGETNYVIYIASTPGNYTALNGSMTLHQVNERYWRINKPMEMFFANQPTDSSPKKSENKPL